jgi:hypothetical protein
VSAAPATTATAGAPARLRFLPRDAAALGFLLVAAPLATWLGLRIGQPAVFAVLTALPAILVFVDRVNAGRLGAALGLMTAWAATQAVVIVLATRWDPTTAAAVIWRGPSYRDEMLNWIQTGVGAEGTPALFLRQHALHYAVFLVASALTCGVAGLVMGAALLNYMSFYVGSLFLADTGANDGLTIALMGWPIWAILRVVGFIAGGVAMAWLFTTMIRRLKDKPARWPGPASHYLSLSLALVILDALLKALLAGHWRETLLRVLTR